MKINYRKRLFLYSIGIFTLFTGAIIAFYLHEEKQFKSNVILSSQKIYLDIIKNYTASNNLGDTTMNELSRIDFLIPEKIRVSVLDDEGFIIYDNKLPSSEWKESEKENIEIRKAFISGSGTSTREFAFNNKIYMFYAVLDKNNIIRIGYLLDDQTNALFKSNYIFLGTILVLYVVVVFFVTFIYNRYIIIIKDLKKFVLSLFNDKSSAIKKFTDDELGEVQTLIMKLNDKLETNKKNTEIEREKLLEHFHYAEEGISFFTEDRENIYTNTHFIQYLNSLFNQPTFNVKSIFTDPLFKEIVRFLDHPGNKKTFHTSLYANGRYFFVHAIIFEDKSFEVIIRDVTEVEKNNFDRAEMTNNIAHELRTPVTSVRGYLETLINNENMAPEKKIEFINRAYTQINRLAEIIQDVVLLSKTNNTPQHLQTEEVNIHDLVNDIIKVDSKAISEYNKKKVIIHIKENVIIQGNKTLLTSIFRNLGNNAAKYAGDNVTITIDNYMEDNEYYYFSFSDNGKGVDEQHLTRIFERFYRVNEGRTRDKGGSGLGLAIVKDAVQFHHGEIIAKNRSEGGLEFLFTLCKK